MKRIVLSLLIVLGVFTGATAQKANMDARKLQLALFAISNLYVDSTSETKLVEDAIVGNYCNERPCGCPIKHTDIPSEF